MGTGNTKLLNKYYGDTESMVLADADDHMKLNFFSFPFHFLPTYATSVLFGIHSND